MHASNIPMALKSLPKCLAIEEKTTSGKQRRIKHILATIEVQKALWFLILAWSYKGRTNTLICKK